MGSLRAKAAAAASPGTLLHEQHAREHMRPLLAALQQDLDLVELCEVGFVVILRLQLVCGTMPVYAARRHM